MADYFAGRAAPLLERAPILAPAAKAWVLRESGGRTSQRELDVGGRKYSAPSDASLALATAFLAALDGRKSLRRVLGDLYGSPFRQQERDAVLALDALRLAALVSFDDDADV